MGDVLLNLGGWASATMTLIALFTLVIKPVRNKVLRWLGESLDIYNYHKKFREHVEDANNALNTYNEKIEYLEKISKKIENLEIDIKKLYEINEKLNDFIDKSKEEESITKEADLCILRKSIIEIYYNAKNKKHLPLYMKENLLELFDIYQLRGGNKYIHSLVDELLKLPSDSK